MLNNNMAIPLMHETVWFDKNRYDEAEKLFEEQAAQERQKSSATVIQEKPKSNTSLAEQIANARQRIINTLQAGDNITEPVCNTEVKVHESYAEPFKVLVEDNMNMRKAVENIQTQLKSLLQRVDALEKYISIKVPTSPTPVKEEKTVSNSTINNHNDGGNDDDDDVDLFGSDDDDEAANKLREERLKAYETKKSKKTAVIAKSSVVLDIKPWDDETDMKGMEIRVRQIESDGLKWGASKLVPLAYGIKKLQIVCVVEDDKVSIDWLQETIQESIDDLVQSVDIAAFNKL